MWTFNLLVCISIFCSSMLENNTSSLGPFLNDCVTIIILYFYIQSQSILDLYLPYVNFITLVLYLQPLPLCWEGYCTAAILSSFLSFYLSFFLCNHFWQVCIIAQRYRFSTLDLYINDNVGSSGKVWMFFYSYIKVVCSWHDFNKIILVPILWTPEEHSCNYRWQKSVFNNNNM